MKKYMIWIALTALILPVIARGLWFYRGVPERQKIATPDYASFSAVPLPLQAPADKNQKVKQWDGVVLMDYAHGNQYQQHEIQSLKEAIEKRGGSVEMLTDSSMLAYKLKYVSAYVTISPSMTYTADETRALKDFTKRGGRLIVFTDATRGIVYTDYYTGTTFNYSDAGAVNPLLAAFGITVNNDYLYNVKKNDGNFRNVLFDKFEKNELTFGLKQVAFYGTHSLKAPAGLVLLRGNEATLSSTDDAHDAAEGGAALSADGNVLALGDFTFLTPPYHNAVNNATFIANIADFFLSGKRALSLENFPFVFNQTEVQVYPSAELTLSAEVIAAIGGLQTALDAMDVNLKLADKAPRAGDMIVLGTFTPADDTAKYLEPFKIELNDEEDFITLPKLGEIGRYGNGILLLQKNKTGSILTLLADNSEDLVSLIGTVSSGSLSSCVLQDNIAICSVGYGGDYYGEDAPVYDEQPPAETTPEAQVTPSG